MNIYNQEENIEFLNNRLGNGMWSQVCGYIGEGNDKYIFAILIDKRNNERFLKELGNGISNEEPVGFTEIADKIIYNMYLQEGKCYFVRHRNYNGIHENYYEISDEFLLIFNAFKQDNKYISVLEDGRTEEIARILTNGSIEIKNIYLKRFAAAKQMNIAFEFDFRVSSDEPFDSDTNDDFTYENDKIKYEFYTGDIGMFKNRYFSRLLGRKIVECEPIETSGIWPFEKETEYDDFIVGCDEKGEAIKCTCNPTLLNNYFNSNPGQYHYLTPVAFKREVLKKYLDHPSIYKIENNHLSCGSLWGIELDLDHDDLIFAYLGDLGRDLPESEHKHWQTFNVLTDEKLSCSTIKRDFGAIFADSENYDFKFQRAFRETNAKWKEKFDWDLFLPLVADDEYCYMKAIMPLVNEQHEFDSLCLTLSKITIDSINVEKIKQNEPMIGNDIGGSINCLNAFLKAKGIGDVSADDITTKLRCIQSLRSQLTGHRKSKDIVNTYIKYGINEYIDKNDYISASKYVFSLITDALNSINNLIMLL